MSSLGGDGCDAPLRVGGETSSAPLRIERPLPPENVDTRDGGNGVHGAYVALFALLAVGVAFGLYQFFNRDDPNQATMPNEFIKGVMIERMHEGEVGWVGQHSICVDRNRKVWISDLTTVLSKKGANTYSDAIRVKKVGDYFEIMIPPELKWSLSTTNYGFLGHYKISKISVAEEDEVEK